MAFHIFSSLLTSNALDDIHFTFLEQLASFDEERHSSASPKRNAFLVHASGGRFRFGIPVISQSGTYGRRGSRCRCRRRWCSGRVGRMGSHECVWDAFLGRGSVLFAWIWTELEVFWRLAYATSTTYGRHARIPVH